LFGFAGFLLVPVEASGAGELTLAHVIGIPCLWRRRRRRKRRRLSLLVL